MKRKTVKCKESTGTFYSGEEYWIGEDTDIKSAGMLSSEGRDGEK